MDRRSMIDQALVSGSLGKALYRDADSRYFVCGIDGGPWMREARSGEVEFLLTLGAEFRELPQQDLTLDHIQKELLVDERKYTALFLLLGGVNSCPWFELRGRYATALGAALIRKGKSAQAADVLNKDMELISRERKQRRTVLLSHVYADLGKIGTARSVVEKLTNIRDQSVNNLRGTLLACYSTRTFHPSQTLRSKIDADEFAIALSA